MPGCLDKCAWLLEDHSIDNVDDSMRDKIIEELVKFKNNQDHDPSVFKFMIKRMCLMGKFKFGEKVVEDCDSHIELPASLSSSDKREVLEYQLQLMNNKFERKSKFKWNILTTIILIAGLLSNGLLGYLNYIKPSSEELQAQLTATKTQLQSCQDQLKNKNITPKLQTKTKTTP